MRYLRDATEAEDVVMVAFTKILRTVSSFQYTSDAGFVAWMYKVVVNEALMAIRKRHNFHLTEALDTENPDHHFGSFKETETEYLYQLILSLPDGYRTVFNLFAVEGYDHQEIATMLGITESTSRSQLFKARQLLKRKMDQEGLHYGT